MPEYGFSLTRIFPYKDRIYYALRENTGQRKPVCWYTLRSACSKDKPNKTGFSSWDIVGNILYLFVFKFYFEISETHMDSIQMSIIVFKFLDGFGAPNLNIVSLTML